MVKNYLEERKDVLNQLSNNPNWDEVNSGINKSTDGDIILAEYYHVDEDRHITIYSMEGTGKWDAYDSKDGGSFVGIQSPQAVLNWAKDQMDT